MNLSLCLLALMSPDPGLPEKMSLEEPPVRRRQQEEPPPHPDHLEPLPRRGSGDGFWSFSAALEMKFLNGRTKVREVDSRPEWLDLGGDLGFDPAAGVRISLIDDSRPLRWFLEAEMLRGSGRGTVDHDFAYDEDLFKGGTPFTTETSVFFARTGIVYKRLFWNGDSGWLGPLVGAEYPTVDLAIHQPAANRTSGEQYKQFMPYPIVGLAGEYEIADSVTLGVRAYGSHIPSVPTIFSEGGRLHMSIDTLSVEAMLTWRLARAVSLQIGVGYQYWAGRLSSKEDGNQLELGMPEALLGLEIRW